MPLETGTYIIRNQGALIGRRLAEDLSFNPKDIIKHPQGFEEKGLGTWKIEKTSSESGSNTYIMRCIDRPTASIDDKVYAILTDEPKPEKWVIEEISHQGKNNYIIKGETKGKGWVAPSGENGTDQILYQTLIVYLTEPPTYPGNELFEIVAKDD